MGTKKSGVETFLFLFFNSVELFGLVGSGSGIIVPDPGVDPDLTFLTRNLFNF